LVDECDPRASGKWLGILELMSEKSLLHDAASCVLQKCHLNPAEEVSLMNLLSVAHIQYKSSSLIPYTNLRNVAASCSGTYALKQSIGMSTIPAD
jgi:hypothetical protein